MDKKPVVKSKKKPAKKTTRKPAAKTPRKKPQEAPGSPEAAESIGEQGEAVTVEMRDNQEHRLRSKPKNTPVRKILNQLALDPSLSQAQLARINNVSQPAIHQMFKRYGINDQYLEEFKKNRADVFAGIQETVLSTLNEDAINKASLRDRTMLVGVLYDKERLERGQSTGNISVMLQAVMNSFGGSGDE